MGRVSWCWMRLAVWCVGCGLLLPRPAAAGASRVGNSETTAVYTAAATAAPLAAAGPTARGASPLTLAWHATGTPFACADGAAPLFGARVEFGQNPEESKLLLPFTSFNGARHQQPAPLLGGRLNSTRCVCHRRLLRLRRWQRRARHRRLRRRALPLRKCRLRTHRAARSSHALVEAWLPPQLYCHTRNLEPVLVTLHEFRSVDLLCSKPSCAIRLSRSLARGRRHLRLLRRRRRGARGLCWGLRRAGQTRAALPFSTGISCHPQGLAV
jgi:hypothetical protein